MGAVHACVARCTGLPTRYAHVENRASVRNAAEPLRSRGAEPVTYSGNWFCVIR